MCKKNLSLKSAIVKKYDKLYLFAQKLGIHPATVTHVITGRWSLKPEQRRQWADALDRPVDELFLEITTTDKAKQRF